MMTNPSSGTPPIWSLREGELTLMTPALQFAGERLLQVAEHLLRVDGLLIGVPVQLPQAGAEPVPEEQSPSLATRVEEPKKGRKPRLDGAGLLRRTFALDVFACVRCGGRRRVLASLTAKGGVGAILEHLELPSRPPRLAPAPGPAQLARC
jgi:hypothetical protein